MKMTPQQRDYVLANAKGRIPGVEDAYEKAKKAAAFVDMMRKPMTPDKDT